MKNFYHILQIEPQADRQTIKAAYKQLMRKYHPDVLSAEQREDREILEKVQEINEAYKTLSDVRKRKEYDQALKEFEARKAAAESPFETRTLLVKCAVTKRTHKMLLAKLKTTRGKFKITGFEPFERPQLTVDDGNWLAKIAGRVRRRPWELSRISQDDEARHPSGLTLDEEDPLGMNDIDWGGQINCPDCKAQVKRANGLVSHWFVCGGCRHLLCVGKTATSRQNTRVSWCPWCGRKIRIDLGDGMKDWTIEGQEGVETLVWEPNLLTDQELKALGDGKK